MVQGLFESFHNNTVPSLQAVEEKARTNGCCSLPLSPSLPYTDYIIMKSILRDVKNGIRKIER